jgi:hypothetical protein
MLRAAPPVTLNLRGMFWSVILGLIGAYFGRAMAKRDPFMTVMFFRQWNFKEFYSAVEEMPLRVRVRGKRSP